MTDWMTDGQLFYLAACAGLAIAVALEHLWNRRKGKP
jgi:hypothetical protein